MHSFLFYLLVVFAVLLTANLLAIVYCLVLILIEPVKSKPTDKCQDCQYKTLQGISEFVSYSNREILKIIGELPVEYRPTFKKLFDYFNNKNKQLEIKNRQLEKELKKWRVL